MPISAKIVSVLRRAYVSAQDAIHTDECLAHYEERPFVPSNRKPTRAEVFEALRTLPYDEWLLNEMLEFDAMKKAGWSKEEIHTFRRGRDEDLKTRGLYVRMSEMDYYPLPSHT